jgi:hypothetical protein
MRVRNFRESWVLKGVVSYVRGVVFKWGLFRPISFYRLDNVYFLRRLPQLLHRLFRYNFLGDFLCFQIFIEFNWFLILYLISKHHFKFVIWVNRVVWVVGHSFDEFKVHVFNYSLEYWCWFLVLFGGFLGSNYLFFKYYKFLRFEIYDDKAGEG